MKKLTQSVLPNLPFLLIIWVVCGSVYFKTLQPSVLYIDAGAMIAGAVSLGIPNPPGFPLYMLIGHLFTLIPIGTHLFRLQLLSVLSALGVLSLVYFLVTRFLINDLSYIQASVPDSKAFGKGLRTGLTAFQARICGLAASLILAFSYEFWSQTLNSESYIFTNFLMITIASLLFTTSPSKKSVGRKMLLISVVLGLGTGANPTIIQFVPALILGIVLFWEYIGLKRFILSLVVVACLTLAIYSYLPIRAMVHPFLNWGDPQTLSRFIGHLRGEGLDIHDPRTNSINGFTWNFGVFSQSLGRYIYLLFVQFTPFLLPLIFIGFFYVFRKNTKLFFSLLVVPITNLVFGLLYLSGNQEAWFIASYVVFSILIGLSLGFLLKLTQAAIVKSGNFNRNYLATIFLLLPIVVIINWFPKLDRSKHTITSDYIDNLYNNLPKNAVLIGSGDFFNSASLYQHEALKKRPDVFPIVSNMWYILPWYRDNLRHQKPDLMPNELEGMIKKTRYEEYKEIMNWYIERLINKGYPVYVTPMVFRESVLAGTDSGKLVLDPDKLKRIESGLAYRILTAKDLLQPDPDSLNKYKFTDPEFFKKRPFYLERNYNGAYNTLMTEYATSYLDMADYLFSIGNQKDPFGSPDRSLQNNIKQRANDMIKRAYDFAPFSPEVLNRLAIFYALHGDIKSGISYFQQAEGYASKDTSIRLNLASAYMSVGNLSEAQKELQFVFDSATDPNIKNEAQKGLAKISLANLAQTTTDWQSLKVASQKFEVKYPNDWKLVKKQNGVNLLTAPDGFQIELYGGFIQTGGKALDFTAKSPIVFDGSKENSGPAQVPGYEATANIYGNEKGKILELIISLNDRIIQVKSSPMSSPNLKELDKVLSSLKFN